MRYHSTEPDFKIQLYGEIYICDHPVYNSCTLFREGEIGLAVIQQRFDPNTKQTRWTDIDCWIANDLYLNIGFLHFFQQRAKPPVNGLFPTVTVRQMMWALKMKPLPKQRWETTFDHNDI